MYFLYPLFICVLSMLAHGLYHAVGLCAVAVLKYTEYTQKLPKYISYTKAIV